MVEFPFLRALYRLGPLDIPSYYLFLFLAIILATRVGMAEAERIGLDRIKILDLAAIMVVSGLFGAKLLHAVAEEPEYYFNNFLDHPFRLFEFWQGGFAYLGGVLFSIPLGILYCRIKKLSTAKVADLAGLSLPVGAGIGRLGCFLAGCCYGKPYAGPMALHYYIYDHVAPQVLAFERSLEGVGLVPTQLLESGSAFLLFILLWSLRRRTRSGELFLLFLTLYPLFRFPIEFLRRDHRGSLFGDSLSTSQFLSLLMFFVGGALLLRSRMNKKTTTFE